MINSGLNTINKIKKQNIYNNNNKSDTLYLSVF